LFGDNTLWPETEKPELSLGFNYQAALLFRSLSGFFRRKLIQMPKERPIRKSHDLHFGEKFAPKIA
jgi:hypothetical protein